MMKRLLCASRRVPVTRTLSSNRAWHEPAVLFPSVAGFRDAELESLKEWVEVASVVDDETDEAAPIVESALQAALAEADGLEGIARAESLLGALGAELSQSMASPPSPRALVRVALARRHATELARSMLPAESAIAVAERALGTKTRWWHKLVPEPDGDGPKPEAELLAVLRTAARGDTAARLKAHFDLVGNDGLVEELEARRVVLDVALPVGLALADVHDALVDLPPRPRLVRRQRAAAQRHIATVYPHHRLDVKAKARCVANWAEKAKTTQTRPPPAIFSADWLVGRGVKHEHFLDEEQLQAAVVDFFPELLTLGRNSAQSLLDKRREHWATVEENRTSQYAVSVFVVACGLLDKLIMAV